MLVVDFFHYVFGIGIIIHTLSEVYDFFLSRISGTFLPAGGEP